MKCYALLLAALILMAFHLDAQMNSSTPPLNSNFKTSKIRIVAGLSVPELFHAGVTYRIANISQVGVNAGLGPTWGATYTAISLEHRLYVGKNDKRTNQKTWFCRQGLSAFPLDEQYSLNLTVGKDITFKNSNDGITIDLGFISLLQDYEYWDEVTASVDTRQKLIHYPAIRFEFYFPL